MNDTIGLGHALLQHHHTGVLLSVASFPFQGLLQALPLSDSLATVTMSMPESWVRRAILVRINSLICRRSAVCWELLGKMVVLPRKDITPCIPLRGSISASGDMFVTFVLPTSPNSVICNQDLTPLAYVAGTVAGICNIRVFDDPRVFGAPEVVSCRKVLERHGPHGIEPLARPHPGQVRTHNSEIPTPV